MKRNFVHVDDLVAAILCAIDHPGRAPPDLQHLHGRAGRLRRAGRLPARDPRPPGDPDSPPPTIRPGSTTRKAKFLLGWRPRYDLKQMVDAAWGYQRAPDDPRKVWYPG